MPKENVRDRSKVKPQGEDAAYLVDQFDMAPREAAELVKRKGEDADKVEQAAQDALKKRDPLKNQPTPKASPSDYTSDADEEVLKPVVRERNMRTSGG